MKEYPKGDLSVEQFHDVFAALTPQLVQLQRFTVVVAKHVFRSFDANKDGRLDFSEFVQALSTLQRGTTHDKLNWIFRIYDIDGEGQITQQEFVEVINAARLVETTLTGIDCQEDSSSVLANSRSSSNTDDVNRRRRLRRVYKIAEAQASELYSCLDRDGSGRVSKEQFLQRAQEKPDISTCKHTKVLSLLLREKGVVFV